MTWVFHETSGRIVKTMICDEETAELNRAEGETLLWVDAPVAPDTHYISGVTPIVYPPRPGPWAVFDYQAGEWADPRTQADLDAELEEARRAGIRAVNAATDAVRRRYVTAITGQDMLYLRKEAEARDYIAAVDPDLVDYPLIAAEVGITAPTAWQVAQVYLGLSAVWISLAAPLETARLGGIALIEAAADVAAIESAVADAVAAITSVASAVPLA